MQKWSKSVFFSDAGQLDKKVHSFPLLNSSFRLPKWHKSGTYFSEPDQLSIVGNDGIIVGHKRVPIVGGSSRSLGGRQEWPSICIIPSYTIDLGTYIYI